MPYTRSFRVLLAVMIVSALMPLSPAAAARNRAPRIMKAVMQDTNGNGLADRVVLTYNEKVRHKADFKKFPFVVQGYRIAKIGAVRGKTTLGIVLKENANAPKTPASIKYMRTRKQPVLDLKRMQARKQLLTKNIIGLAATPPPPPQEFTLSIQKTGDGVVKDGASKIDCGTTCSAKYPAGTSVTLTATPDAATQSTFSGWGGCSSTTATCTVTVDADKTVTAAFAKAGTFALTVAKAGAGTGTVTSTSAPTQTAQINCGSTCVANYPKDAVVTLTATPDQASGSTFTGFTGGGCTGSSTTCNVKMTAATTVTATFAKVGSFALTLTKAGAGTGTVTSTSSPTQSSQINCGASCVASYPAGTQVTLTAAPDQASSSTFSGFSGGGCTGSSTSCVVIMDKDQPVTATFNGATKQTLQIQKTGTGTVKSTSNPTQTSQIDCGATCSADFPTGATVTLTAAPGENFKFAGWSGGSCTGDSTTCNVTMDGPKTVTATFDAIPAGTTHTLTATAVNGTVTCLADTGGTSCEGPYPAGTQVTMTALPAVGMDPLSATWTGCSAAVGSLNCSVIMDAPKTVTVSFSAPTLPDPLTGTTSTTVDTTTGTLPLPNVQR